MSGEDGDTDLEIEEPSEGSDPHDTVEPVETAPGARPRAHLLAFGAGRGGTGRSLIAANIAVYLAQAGKKVVAIDADPAGGPLHQLLGRRARPAGSVSSCAGAPRAWASCWSTHRSPAFLWSAARGRRSAAPR